MAVVPSGSAVLTVAGRDKPGSRGGKYGQRLQTGVRLRSSLKGLLRSFDSAGEGQHDFESPYRH